MKNGNKNGQCYLGIYNLQPITHHASPIIHYSLFTIHYLKNPSQIAPKT